MATDPKTGQYIFHGATAVGPRNVGSYQVSGTPWITGSQLGFQAEKEISFPYVTKSFTVIQSGSHAASPQHGDLRIHFASTSSGTDVIAGHHYISLETNNDSMTFNVKCKKVYISNASTDAFSGFEILAELTNIPTAVMWDITGSGISTIDGS